jgi:hypothetical protein
VGDVKICSPFSRKIGVLSSMKISKSFPDKSNPGTERDSRMKI